MKQTIDVRPKMSDEDRKALRLFRLSAFVAGVVAIAVATGFGFALRPFLHWDADRTGAERRAQERLRDIEEAAAKREADLLRVFEEKKKALDSAIASEEKRKASLEIDIVNVSKRESKAIQAANEAEEELASKRKEIADEEPTLARVRSKIADAETELDSIRKEYLSKFDAVREFSVSNTVLIKEIALNQGLLDETKSGLIKAKGELTNIESAVRSRTSELETKRLECLQVSNEIARVQSQIDEKSGMLNNLVKRIRTYVNYTNQIPMLREECQKLRAEKKELEELTSGLEETKNELSLKKQSLQEAQDARTKAIAEESQIRERIKNYQRDEEQAKKDAFSAKEMEQVARQRHNELEAAVSKKEAELKLIQDKIDDASRSLAAIPVEAHSETNAEPGQLIEEGDEQ